MTMVWMVVTDINKITCEPRQISNECSKWGFTNLETPMVIDLGNYGFPPINNILGRVPREDIENLPGQLGDIVQTEIEGDIYWYFYGPDGENPEALAWMRDYSVEHLGYTRSILQTWEAILTKTKAMRQETLSLNYSTMGEFNWQSLYIPRFTLNKYF